MIGAMDTAQKNAAFAGTIPEHYEAGLGPVIFVPYADDLARRIAARVTTGHLLETACGTGLLTRRLDALLARAVRITATDLNEGMLAHARSKVAPSERLDWQTADAAALPFAPETFDAVACQFGLMFVPDKAMAFREARRVLLAGGQFFFSVWCRIEENPFARIAHATIGSFFASNPPTFYQVPFGFHDPKAIASHLRDSRFGEVSIERVDVEVVSPSARDFARGLVEGNPIVNAIREAALPFGKIVDAVTAALVAEGGDAPFRSTTSALVCSARAD